MHGTEQGGKAAQGVVNDAGIRRMVAQGQVKCPPTVAGQVQPASLDLRLGHRAYRLMSSFLPGKADMDDRLADLSIHEFDLRDGMFLETDAVYMVELQESLALPEDVCGKANPKSSTGRLDVFVRLVAENAVEFDTVPSGYRGRLWLEIAPKTFPIKVRTGSRLAQMRFQRGSTRLSDAELASVHARDPLVDTPVPVLRNGLCLGVDLTPDADGIVGWRALRHTAAVDVDQPGALDRHDYWEPLRVRRGGGLILAPGEFYILASRESVTVPPDLAAEMVPFDAGVGEFRVHYAGFFDPGFGYGPGNASRGVLEVRAHDVPFLVEHGQGVARLVYERMAELPEDVYGANLRSNYQGQGLKLGKHFK